MRQARIRVSPVILLAFLVGCAGSPQARTETGAVIVKDLGKIALNTCTESKAAGWHPLTQSDCTNISIGYSAAWDSAKRAVRVQRAGGKIDVTTLMEIAGWVVNTVAILQEAGVDLPENVLTYTEGVKAVLK